jgi:prepilin-type N-terminal cleavage/methylation domain-containing protein
MVKRCARGFTLMEVLVALSLFGVFLYIVVQLTAQMRFYEVRLPIDYLAHPQTGAVIARLRKDVLDATTIPTHTSDTLTVESLQESGFTQTITWDFSTPGEAHRRAVNVGVVVSDWTARGVPKFLLDDFPKDNPDSVRIQAIDNRGQLAIDQILRPRSHN